jgi:hypothetical protein
VAIEYAFEGADGRSEGIPYWGYGSGSDYTAHHHEFYNG